MELLEPTQFVSLVASSKKEFKEYFKEYFEELSIYCGYYD